MLCSRASLRRETIYSHGPASCCLSGVHATLAGVAVALAIPDSGASDQEGAGVSERLEHNLHPWVTFGVLPLFAFANAGLPLHGLSLTQLVEAIPLGIALGLFVGKPVGIFGASWLAIRSGLCRRPESASWMQLFGVAVLGVSGLR